MRRARAIECGHFEKVHYAKGMCRACYEVYARPIDAERKRQRDRKAYRKRRENRPDPPATPDSRCRGLEPAAALVTAEILADLGRIYRCDDTAECRKADYWIAA
jgi:hypothetical protein